MRYSILYIFLIKYLFLACLVFKIKHTCGTCKVVRAFAFKFFAAFFRVAEGLVWGVVFVVLSVAFTVQGFAALFRLLAVDGVGFEVSGFISDVIDDVDKSFFRVVNMFFTSDGAALSRDRTSASYAYKIKRVIFLNYSKIFYIFKQRMNWEIKIYYSSCYEI